MADSDTAAIEIEYRLFKTKFTNAGHSLACERFVEFTIYAGEGANPQRHHHLHLATTFGWMGLLLAQLLLLSRGRTTVHRRIGLVVLIAAPLLASVALLTVHSAHRGIQSGEGDILIVQNVLGTFCLAAMLALAFIFAKRRKLHGAFLMSTLLLFPGPALFFALLAFAPPVRIEGPETFYRFGFAAITGQGLIPVIPAYFFVRDRRNNWPYLLAAGGFLAAEALKVWLTQARLIDPLTRLTGELSQGWAFAIGLMLLLAIGLRLQPKSVEAKTAKPEDSATR
ncbi:hypothetical protein [Sphingomonas glaciei]|uniref:Uncharacterized protein n=1 Tax=Sphingomonas glaciei TaxID=2938948 RepID=A0ABY5N1S2_9SPHN|nr:hypothetical protein [Sphingomonas glaciei]UUR09512.1 hypothetical protein M1K48_13275 [Sphingomonas glaciei]